MLPAIVKCRCIKCDRDLDEYLGSPWFCWSCGTGITLVSCSWDFSKESLSITLAPVTALEVFEIRICPPSP